MSINHAKGPKLRARVGSASRPISKFFYCFSAQVRSRWMATAHIVLCEICTLPLRMAAVLRERFPEEGLRLPRECQPGVSPLPIARACIRGMEKLQTGSGRLVFGWLDRRLYAQGFDDGARYLYDRTCSKRGDVMEHPYSSEQSIIVGNDGHTKRGFVE